jgi:hypothetical protein
MNDDDRTFPRKHVTTRHLERVEQLDRQLLEEVTGGAIQAGIAMLPVQVIMMYGIDPFNNGAVPMRDSKDEE